MDRNISQWEMGKTYQSHTSNSLIPSQISVIHLKNVLRVPSIASNLASVHQICQDNNCWCYFDENILSIQALAMGKVLYKAKSEGGVYPIYPHKASKLLLSPKLCNSVFKTTPCWLLWHTRLGHPNHQVLSLLFPNKTLSFNKCMNLVNTCTHCLHGKMHKLPFPDSKFIARSPFELVHINLWGPAPQNSVNGYKYYVLFVDHFTFFTWLYLLKNKSEVFSKFLIFKALVENQFSTTIKTLRSDGGGGGEYTSKDFTSYIAFHGIAHQISCPYTPQQNGLVERKHRHLIETTITLLSQASLPSQYWSFAVQTAVSLINLLPTATFGL